ncbi:MAG TPA: hypothetical protein VFN23_20875 [Ktedonobacteraceae bacterium]|nr:hypothetical protein [Ktedonobacteraceae bacterium]
MNFAGNQVSDNALTYFLDQESNVPLLKAADVILRVNMKKLKLFPRLIREATNSHWSHSGLIYVPADRRRGFDNTFLVEATTKGVRMASWRQEVLPFHLMTIGVKRLPMDWYTETPYELNRHNRFDPEDQHGIGYLRHVRGMALDHINDLYNHSAVYEMAARYSERFLSQNAKAIPGLVEGVAGLANFFKHMDESTSKSPSLMRFMCSGLVQFSFFEALRNQIAMDLDIPAHREAAERNLANMHQVVFREDDTEGVIDRYIHDVQTGKRSIKDNLPGEVYDFLQTATPADFNFSRKLKWQYIDYRGAVWEIHEVPDGYQPASKEEAEVLSTMQPLHKKTSIPLLQAQPS